MNLALIKDQGLAINRCVINIDRSKSELERVFRSGMNYKSESDHKDAIKLASEGVDLAHVVLENQLKQNAAQNGFLNDQSDVDVYVNKRLAELEQDVKEAGITAGGVILLLKERICEIKGLIAVLSKGK